GRSPLSAPASNIVTTTTLTATGSARAEETNASAKNAIAAFLRMSHNKAHLVFRGSNGMKWIALVLLGSVLPVAAQWVDGFGAHVPRTKDGRPDLTAPAPRVNGRPDLSGFWAAERTSDSEFRSVLGPSFATLQVDYDTITK